MTRVGFRWYDDTENGTFMCCLCFEQVPLEDAWQCPHGMKLDNCNPCGDENGCGGLLHD